MKTDKCQPYLSIVMCSRNDNHGGSTLQRVQISLDARLKQLEKYCIESELILVDWNPPLDKPLLKDVIKLPKKMDYCSVRTIIVPPSIHQRYEYSDKYPMNIIAATNCGIRRARGKFILPGAIDLIYSNELFLFIASKALKPNERYRVDRKVVLSDQLDELLEYCYNNVIGIRVQTFEGNRRFWQRSLPNLHTDASGDFQLMSRENWHILRGYRNAEFIGAYVDGLLCYASYMAGIKEVVLRDPIRVYHIDHDDKFVDVEETAKLPLQDWLSFAFFPAWVNMKVLGLYRRFLELFGYKIKASYHGIPTLSFLDYQKICRKLIDGKRAYVFNDNNWGLGGEFLEEFVMSVADWEEKYGKN